VGWCWSLKMKQVILILLKKDVEVEKIRKKYHPDYKKFEPHISLVCPFEVNNQDELFLHIKESLKGIKSFDLSLEGLQKSAKGHYLYLLVGRGREKVMKLYWALNKSILKDFKNEDMPKYIPHLSLGFFKSKKEIDDAIEDMGNSGVCFKTKISSIQLVTLNKDSSLKSVNNFGLNI